MKTLRIISVLGVILSAGAALYASMQYIALSHSTEIIGSLSQSNDVAIPKIQAMLDGHTGQGIILDALKSQHGQIASLHQAYLEIAVNGKFRAVQETALWIIAGFFFLIVLARTHEEKGL